MNIDIDAERESESERVCQIKNKKRIDEETKSR
jgi:hypothetical protein